VKALIDIEIEADDREMADAVEKGLRNSTLLRLVAIVGALEDFNHEDAKKLLQIAMQMRAEAQDTSDLRQWQNERDKH
jgi:hypothetical protein